MAVINNWLAEFLKWNNLLLQADFSKYLGMTYRDPLATLCSSVWLVRKEGRELAEMVGKLPLQNISQSFYSLSAKGKDPNISSMIAKDWAQRRNRKR